MESTQSLTVPALDVAAVRRQFPSLTQTLDGAPVIFLDNPAGTQVPQRVIDRVADFWMTRNANLGGPFLTSERADALVSEGRAAAAAFVNAAPDEIVFGANMTTLAFSISRAIGRELAPGDEIVLTRLEHEANVGPWMALETLGVRVRFADINVEDCTLDLADLERLVTRRTRIIAVTHASNAVGTIPDLRRVAALARASGAWLWVDAVHFAPHGSIDVRAVDCDFLVCSAYKFYGPHLGVCYLRRDLQQRLRPFKVRPALEVPPERWETGTPNLEGIAGLLGALEYLAALGGGSARERGAFVKAMALIQPHERSLVRRLLEGLMAVPGLRIHGITHPNRLEQRVPTVSVTWPPHRPEDLARWLGRHGVFTWHGDHFATGLIERLGLAASGGTLRIGIAHYNTASEIDQTVELLASYRD